MKTKNTVWFGLPLETIKSINDHESILSMTIGDSESILFVDADQSKINIMSDVTSRYQPPYKKAYDVKYSFQANAMQDVAHDLPTDVNTIVIDSIFDTPAYEVNHQYSFLFETIDHFVSMENIRDITILLTPHSSTPWINVCYVFTYLYGIYSDPEKVTKPMQLNFSIEANRLLINISKT